MKSSYLFVAFLLATLFAFQAQSLRLAKNQMPLDINTGDRNYFSRLGFKQLLETSTHANDPTQTIANVFRYYIDGRDYFNYIQSLYCEANTSGGKYITLEQFFQVTDAQGVHRVDAHRVSEYVRGVFGTVHNDTDDTPIDAFTFNQAAELLFAESVSIVTFSYIVQSSRHSRHVTVTVDEVESALVKVFNTYGDLLPAPNCDEIRYLFNQSDVDQDGELNLQEFHVFLSIYLRFYKYGIQNNRYAVTVMKDNVFEYVWNNEDGLGGHTERSNFLKLAFARFLQMTVYDRIQNQMSHLFFTKFDSDGSGAIDKREFGALLSFFHAPEDEVDVLFAAADADGSGEVDFAEFVLTLTTLLRKLTADLGYSSLTLGGAEANVENTYAIFKEATSFLRLEIISKETFEATFEAVDEDGNVVLDLEEFTKFLSEIIGLLRAKVRLEEEAQISAVAGLDVDEATPESIEAAKEEASQQVSDIVYSDQDLTPEDAIGQVSDNTGYTEEEIEEAAENHVGGATVEQVIEAAEQIATEEIINAVTEAAIAEAESTGCPTQEAIEDAIEEVLHDGTVDDIIETIENTSGEEIIAVVTEVVHEQHPEEYPPVQIGGDRDEASQQVDDYIYTEPITEESALEEVLEETGATQEEIEEAIESQIGAGSVEEVIDAVEQAATEEVIDAVTEAVIEAAASSDCPTEEAIEQAIEEVLTDGTVDDIVEEIENATGEEIIETVAEVVEEGHDHTEDVTQEIVEETGYTEEEIEEVIDSQIGGGATVEDVIEAAEEIATEEVIDAVTEAVIEAAASSDCPTEEAIEEAIEEVIEDGIIEEIVEEIEEASTEDIVEAVTEVVEEGHSHSSDSSDSESSDEEHHHTEEAIVEEIEETTGYTIEEVSEVIESQIGGATVEDVIEAAEEIATEEVIEAVAEAVLENASGEECTTPESIQAAVEEAIEDGVVEEVLEQLEESSPEELVEAVAEVVEEEHHGHGGHSDHSDHEGHEHHGHSDHSDHSDHESHEHQGGHSDHSDHENHGHHEGHSDHSDHSDHENHGHSDHSDHENHGHSDHSDHENHGHSDHSDNGKHLGQHKQENENSAFIQLSGFRNFLGK